MAPGDGYRGARHEDLVAFGGEGLHVALTVEVERGAVSGAVSGATEIPGVGVSPTPGREPWKGYENPPWLRRDKKKVTVLYNYVERWKSFFFKAHLERKGYRCVDLGDHVKEDLAWGKEYGNRMECNPMYFTSGALIRNLGRVSIEGMLHVHAIG